jgi:hypothetical protein
MPRRESVTAKELRARLESNPEWVERQRRKDEHFEALNELLRQDEASLVTDLAAVGWPVESVWDLVNTSKSYPEAIPVLLQHLPRPYHKRTREGIVRALAVLEAEGLAGPAILRELQRETDENLRWVLANTLCIVATPEEAQGIRDLLADPGYADTHERLGQALKNVT